MVRAANHASGGASCCPQQLPCLSGCCLPQSPRLPSWHPPSASAAAAEVMEVNAAVAALREQLAEMQSNTDPSRRPMIRLNVREAEETLARWV